MKTERRCVGWAKPKRGLLEKTFPRAGALRNVVESTGAGSDGESSSSDESNKD